MAGKRFRNHSGYYRELFKTALVASAMVPGLVRSADELYVDAAEVLINVTNKSYEISGATPGDNVVPVGGSVLQTLLLSSGDIVGSGTEAGINLDNLDTTTNSAPLTINIISGVTITGGDVLDNGGQSEAAITNDFGGGTHLAGGGLTINNYGAIDGNASYGCYFQTTGVGPNTVGDININNYSGGTINGGTLEDASAIEAGSNKLTLYNAGTISTSADGAFGLSAGGNDSSVQLRGGDITTTGNDAVGIVAWGDSFTLFVDQDSEINTSGNDAIGVAAGGTGGNMQVDGSINTDNGYGIALYGAESATVNLMDNGSITTLEDHACGIYTEDTINSNITIASGAVISTGAVDGSIGSVAYGIYLYNDSTGSNNNRIEVYGEIKTTGNEAKGIYVEESHFNQIRIEDGGKITTGINGGTGEEAHGIHLYAGSNNNTIVVSSTAEITTNGADALGIFVEGDDNSITLNGSVETTALSDGIGIEVVGKSNLVSVAGGITTSGEYSYGIVVSGGESNNASEITLSGSIHTAGSEATGIEVDDYSEITIASTGEIVTQNTCAQGIRSYGNSEIVNHGRIDAQHSSANGIFVSSGTASITNTGTISGGKSALKIAGCNDNIDVSIDNEGTLTGGVLIGDVDGTVLKIQGNSSVGDITATASDPGYLTKIFVGYDQAMNPTTDGKTGAITSDAGREQIWISGAGHVNGDISLGGGDDGVYFNGSDGSKVTGDVNLGSGSNIISFSNSGTINGAIIDGGGTDTVEFGGHVTAAIGGSNATVIDTIDFSFSAGNLISQGTGNFTVLNTAGANSGDITINSSGTNNLTFGAAHTGLLSVNYDTEITGASYLQGSITVGNNATLTATGNLTLKSDKVLTLGINDSTHATLNVLGDLTIEADAKFKASGAVRGNLTDIPVITYRDDLSVGGSVVTDSDFDFDAAYLDTAILDFTMNHVAADDTIYMSVKASEIAPKGTTVSQKEIGKIFDGITGGSAPISQPMSDMISTIQNLSTEVEVSQALQELSPIQMTATPIAVIAATQSLGDVISGHMSNISANVNAARIANATVTSSNGNVLMNVDGDMVAVRENERWTPFFETFHSWGDQDDQDGISGYDFNTTGFVLGTDYLVDDQLLIGISFAHMDTKVDSNDNLASTDIETWQSNLFGSYFTEDYHIDMHLGVGSSNIDAERMINFMGTTAESDHDAVFYNIGLGGGYIFRPSEGMTLEPFAEMNYMYMDEEGYEEKGAGGANLKVDENTIESLRSILGVKLAQRVEFEGGIAITPEISYKWQHEFENDPVQNSASFVNGGSNFKTNGMDVDDDHHIFGLGIKAEIAENMNIYANYERDVADGFSANSALIGIELKF